VRTVLLFVSLAAAGIVTGCSSSSASSPNAQPSVSPLASVTCPDSFGAAFAPRGAATSTQEVTAGLSTCSYDRRTPKAGACTAATVTINTNPQPFKDFQRWVVETTQNAGTARLGKDFAPQQVDGIGIEADWVPGTLTFETANNERWIAVQLRCPSSGPPSLALAESLAKAALTAAA
jgi:hypothetical protein